MVFTKLTQVQKEGISEFEIKYGKQGLPALRAMIMRGTPFEDATKIVLASPPKMPKVPKPGELAP